MHSREQNVTTSVVNIWQIRGGRQRIAKEEAQQEAFFELQADACLMGGLSHLCSGPGGS